MAFVLRAVPIVFAGCALLACGSITAAGSGGRPTTSQQNELSSSVQDEVAASLAALTVSAPGTPAFFPVIAGCPTQSSTTDADGDGIPNDATLTYSNPPCTATGFRGGSLGVTGALRIQDPSAGNSTSFDLTLTDLAWGFADSLGAAVYTSIRNGTRVRLGSTSAAKITNTLTTQRQRPTISTATLTIATVDSFIASTPGALLVGQPLPSGLFAVKGSLSWHRSTENWNLVVATTVALQYDATCLTTAQRIKAGQITLTGTVANVPGVLAITWSACGTDPARQWIAASP
ncbi:MAG: hypothetical protein ABI742_14710 [Gemmatimonadota bacterium]